MILQDLSGQKFGRLLVKNPIHSFRLDSKRVYNCLCDCGNTKNVLGDNLQRGTTKSCGCLSQENRLTIRKTHGEAHKTKEYNTWMKIKGRCLNVKDKRYEYYGARGITVCSRWLESYTNFLQDMGRAPTPKHSIDRINNMGNYEPSNCKWSTAKEQSKNRRPRRTKLQLALALLLLPFFCQAQNVHCFDLNESRQIHQMALQKLYGDSLVSELEGKVIILENDNKETTKDYMALLDNTALKIYEQGQREAGLMRIIDNYQTEIKSVRKKSTWRSIQKWVLIGVAGGLIAIK